MKTSVSSYSFQRLINSGRETQLSIIKIAKDMGFDAIEFTELSPPQGVDKLAYAAEIKEECAKCGIEISNYTVGANLMNNTDEEIKRLKECINVADVLGAKGMRHDATGGFGEDERIYKSFDSALPIISDACRSITEYAAEKGIKTMVENHGYFCQESRRVEKLVEAVGNPNFGVLIDIGNFMCADEASELAVGRLALFAKHVHVKDFHFKNGSLDNPGRGFFKSRAGNFLRGAIVGHGIVPVRQCLSILKNAGYDGFVSIEFEGMEENTEAIGISLENLKNYMV